MIGRRELLGAAAAFLAPKALAASPDGGDAAPFLETADGVFVRQGADALMNAANRGGTANLGFIVGQDGVAMIDSGGSPADAAGALRAIRSVTDRPVRCLVNTHMHPDHVLGNQVFKAADAEIVGHARLPAALEARRETYLATMRAELGESLVSRVAILLPDSVVENERMIDLGGRSLRLKAWGTAHTDNDLTVLDEDSGILFAGDLVFIGHVPVLDGSLKGWLAQVEALQAVPARRVVPGHGPVGAPWPAALDAQTAYLEILARDIRRAIADGTRLGDAVATAGRSEASRWTLFDDYHPRNATAAFAELEWE